MPLLKRLVTAKKSHRFKSTVNRRQIALSSISKKEVKNYFLSMHPSMVFEIDGTGTYTKIYAKDETRLYKPSTSLIGKSISDVLPIKLQDLCFHAMSVAYTSGIATDLVYQLDISGAEHWFEMCVINKSRKRTRKSDCAYIFYIRDVSKTIEIESDLQSGISIDLLTGLGNRKTLQLELKRLLENSSYADKYIALVLIDIDRFSLLNDSYGSQIGDQHLREISSRLRLIADYSPLIVRTGNDEFAVVLTHLDESVTKAETELRNICDNLVKRLNFSFEFSDGKFLNSISIGAALVQDKGLNPSSLLMRSELALYQARREGGNRYQFYSDELSIKQKEQAQLENDLRTAITEDQLEVYLQPICRGNKVISGYEVLVRWNHPGKGLLSPALFIPVAEQSDLIIDLGNWVLKNALPYLAHWQLREETRHLTLSINISSRQVQSESFIPEVMGLVHKSNAPAHRLQLELTESMLQFNVEDTISKMKILSRNGISFSLDDFGTGYSSLSYLKKLPLHQLKIDRSFVCDISKNSNSAAIAKMIVQLSKTLNLDVVAEGVEEEDQYNQLLGLGCNAFQGYLFGRPEPAIITTGMRL